MDDILYLGIAVVLFILTWGLLKMCEVLGEEKSGGNV
jgi:hypothetical protein